MCPADGSLFRAGDFSRRTNDIPLFRICNPEHYTHV